MYLLYLDDSGSAGNTPEDHLVLGEISLLENQVGHITQELDRIARELNPSDPDAVEFHASDIYAGRQEPWKSLSRDARRNVIKQVLCVLADSYGSANAFACAVHKSSYPSRDPMEMAFEDLCSRFDIFLRRKRDEGENHRGLIILDDSTYETTLQQLARKFRSVGTQWNVIRNIADVPLFVDSRASRCVQLADHVAYAVFRRYNSGDTNYLDVVLSRFDCVNKVLHGLCHKRLGPPCPCPACMCR